MGTCKRTRTIVKQIGSQQPIGERLGQPWTKETYMSQKPKRLLVLFPCIWWFTLTPGLQFLLNGISVLRLRKDPGYNRVYIYIVCVCMCICIYINLYLKIYVYVNIHWHTHISLSIILYTIQMLTTYILNYASLLRAFQVNPENLLTLNPWLPWNWHSSRTAAAMYGYVILHTSNLRYHTTSELFSPLHVHIYI